MLRRQRTEANSFDRALKRSVAGSWEGSREAAVDLRDAALQRVGTSWGRKFVGGSKFAELERVGTSWNELERVGTSEKFTESEFQRIWTLQSLTFMESEPHKNQNFTKPKPH